MLRKVATLLCPHCFCGTVSSMAGPLRPPEFDRLPYTIPLTARTKVFPQFTTTCTSRLGRG